MVELKFDATMASEEPFGPDVPTDSPCLTARMVSSLDLDSEDSLTLNFRFGLVGSELSSSSKTLLAKSIADWLRTYLEGASISSSGSELAGPLSELPAVMLRF